MQNDDGEDKVGSNCSFVVEETESPQSNHLNRSVMAQSKHTQERFFDCHPMTSAMTQEEFCHVKMDTIYKLKDSTKKLLHILEQIQAKTRKKLRISEGGLNIDGAVQPKSLLGVSLSQLNISDIVPNEALLRLEVQTRVMQNINVDYEDDDCSIYKRLTRKCNCLNNKNYNDLVIHFNENTKYTTNNIGEIVKNMRILKKFLYMGGTYTANSLMFLNEGLSRSNLPERIEIINGCTNADICGVFDEHSIVVVCISWPCKNDYFGDAITQLLRNVPAVSPGFVSRGIKKSLIYTDRYLPYTPLEVTRAWTATLLQKLAEVEDGRRYLNFSSKITNDIKKVIRKRSYQLDINVVETLQEVLSLLRPIFVKNPNVSYVCKPANEGIGSRTIKDLVESREHMTLNEISMHLDLLRNFSKLDFGKDELTYNLPALLLLFKDLLLEYDNSEMNILIMNIMTNLMTNHMKRSEGEKVNSNLTISDACTEPIISKNQSIQIPLKKNPKKIGGKSIKGLGVPPAKLINQSRRKDWEPSNNLLNRSRKFNKDMRSSIIVVPIEK